jgi:hypothetical protein
MEPITPPASQQPSTRSHALVAICLLLASGIFLSGLDLLAHHQPLANWIEHNRLISDQQQKVIHSQTGYFADFEDRLVLEELPAADYSKGGVYLLGSSNAKWATHLWDLPADQRALIHNYGIGGSNYKFLNQFVHFLIAQQHLLQAGPQKTFLILGVSYQNISHGLEPTDFAPALWTRHGLYTYSPTTGIQPTPMLPFLRGPVAEQQQIGGLISALSHAASDRFRPTSHEPRQHRPREYQQTRIETMGPAWETTLQQQAAEFDTLLKYLHAQNVKVAVVFLPMGTWEKDLPFQAAFEKQMSGACLINGIAPLDWTRLLDDDDFADSVHANLSGMEKLQQAFLSLARPFLEQSGAPAPSKR